MQARRPGPLLRALSQARQGVRGAPLVSRWRGSIRYPVGSEVQESLLLAVAALRSRPRDPSPAWPIALAKSARLENVCVRGQVRMRRRVCVHVCACVCTCAQVPSVWVCMRVCVQVSVDAVESPMMEVVSRGFCDFLLKQVAGSPGTEEERAKARRREPCRPPSPEEAGESPPSPVPDPRDRDRSATAQSGVNGPLTSSRGVCAAPSALRTGAVLSPAAASW